MWHIQSMARDSHNFQPSGTTGASRGLAIAGSRSWKRTPGNQKKQTAVCSWIWCQSFLLRVWVQEEKAKSWKERVDSGGLRPCESPSFSRTFFHIPKAQCPCAADPSAAPERWSSIASVRRVQDWPPAASLLCSIPFA